MTHDFKSAFDNIAARHGRRWTEIYVLLSSDGSTLVVDPGLKQPWSSPNKRLADDHAKNLTRQGIGCYAVDIPTALHSIIRHPKNAPQ